MLTTSNLEQAVPAVLCSVTANLVPATPADRLHLLSAQTYRNNFVNLKDNEKRLEALCEYIKIWRGVYKFGLTGQPSSTAPIVFVWKDLCAIGGRFDTYACPAMQVRTSCFLHAFLLHILYSMSTLCAVLRPPHCICPLFEIQ